MFYLYLVSCLIKSKKKNASEKKTKFKKSKNAYVRVNTDKHVQQMDQL